MSSTMHVEIWSDVMCPFCYIGKRRFEEALNQFAHKSRITVIWKSFQLDPNVEAGEYPDYAQFLSQKKGLHPQQVSQMLRRVTEMAHEVGLRYHFEKAVVANSYQAHRFSHLAYQYGLQNEAEEALFAAHFTQGKDIADAATLIELGVTIGLERNKIQQMLESEQYATEVQIDIREASQIGVQGVPFFVFNRRYAVSGAQDTSVFAEVLSQSFAEWYDNINDEDMQVQPGEACMPDGVCA